MTETTGRRRFLQQSLALAGASVLAGDPLAGWLAGADTSQRPLLAVAKGADYFAGTRKAVELLGGMSKFIRKGDRVGLLLNAPRWWRTPGSFTSPVVAIATVLMCLDAGAKEIIFLQDPAPDYWQRDPSAARYQESIRSIKPCSGKFVPRVLKQASALKNAQVIRELLECDKFINLPVAKHHEGTHFSGCLKNYMGNCPSETNRFFHSGSGSEGYGDLPFLSRCVADVNSLRRPDLCIADASVVLANNGPAGPGELLRPQRIVAGTDPVGVDAYCVTLHNRQPADVMMLGEAAGMGLGLADPAKFEIREVKV